MLKRAISAVVLAALSSSFFIPSASADTTSTISLTSNKTELKVNEAAKLSISTNSVDTSKHIYIEDKTLGKIIADCDVYSSPTNPMCTRTTSFGANNTVDHTYVAYLANNIGSSVTNSSALTISAQSAELKISRAKWNLYVSATKSTVAQGDPVINLTANANQNISGSGYEIYFFNKTTDTYLDTSNSTASATSYTRSFTGERSNDLVAYVAKDTNTNPTHISDLQDVQATSNAMTLERKPWSGTITTRRYDPSSFNPVGAIGINFATNQKLYSDSYHAAILDADTNRIIRRCGSSTNVCDSDVYPSYIYNDTNYPTAKHFRVVVGLWSGGTSSGSTNNPTGYMYDLQYDSGIIDLSEPTSTYASTNTPAISLTSAHMYTGGTNLSQACPQTCEGDPINTATGEFWENDTDISAGGVDNEIKFIRSYSVSDAGTDTGLGYGWRSNYAMSLKTSESSLSTAASIIVSQENGSLVTFTRNSNGQLTAPAAVKATLTARPDGTFVFLRDKQQKFVFNANGQLISTIDLHSNTNTLTYSANGLLQSVSDTKGHALTFTYDANNRISTIKDQENRTVTYHYDNSGNLTSVSNVDAHDMIYAYNGDHLITSMTNLLGGITTNTYDQARRVTNQKDPLGNIINFAYEPGQTTITYPDGTQKITYYDNQLRVIASTSAVGSPLEATTSYSYDDQNLPVTITDPLGRQTSMTYDDDGNKLSETDVLGRITSFTYNSLNQPLTITDPAGNVTTMTYNAAGDMLSAKSAQGRIASSTFNADGTLASVTTARGNESGADKNKFTSIYSYNPNGTLKSVTDPLGNVKSSVSNSLGWVSESTDERGNKTSYTYNNSGVLLSTTDAKNNITSMSLDAANNVLSTTNPLNEVTSSVYNVAGLLTSQTNAKNNTTLYTYDNFNRLSKVTNPAGKVSSYTYDALGNQVSETDELNRTNTVTYDRAGQKVKSQNALGRVTNYTYDAAGNLIQETDPDGDSVTYDYDVLDRLSRSTTAMGVTNSYVYDVDGMVNSQKRSDGTALSWKYDADGNQTQAIDATGIAATSTYDANKNLLTSVDRNNRTTSYTYDAASNVKTKTAADNMVTTYAYDVLNQQIGIDYSDTTKDVTNTYDALGRLLTEATSSDTVAYAYDANGNMTRRGPPNSTSGVSYTYTNLDQIASITYPSGRIINYGYDDAGQNTSITTANMGSITNTFNADSLLATQTLPSGVVTTNTFDIADRLIDSTSRKGTATVYSFSNSYDDDGRVTSKASGASGSTSSKSASYDALSRLSSYGDAITFDSRGNIVKRGSITNTFDNAGQQLTSVNGTNTTSYLYDGRGNRKYQTTKNSSAATTASATYTYDGADRLTSAQLLNKAKVSYGYDPSGLRTSRQEGTATAKSLSWDVNTEVPVILDDSTYEFVYPAGSYIPVAQIKKSDKSIAYLHADTVGSVMGATSSTGTVLGNYTYDAYGVSTSTRVTPFGYAGQYQDPITGLYDFRARVYDPATASFLQRDPAELMTDDPYAYATGNPLRYVDPSGLASTLSWKDKALTWDGFDFADTQGWKDTTNWVAGFGDGASFGITKSVRGWLGANSVICDTSEFYKWGNRGGFISTLPLPLGVGKGILAKLAMPNKMFVKYREMEKGYLGFTDIMRGEAYVSPGLSPLETLLTIQHEKFHAVLTTNIPIVNLARKILVKRSMSYRFIEEVAAESYAKSKVAGGFSSSILKQSISRVKSVEDITYRRIFIELGIGSSLYQEGKNR